MHLHSLHLSGFKSYPTPTTLTPFHPHFNAITGLNGSGKSNLLDAICFVLGTQDLKAIRCGGWKAAVYKEGNAGVQKVSILLIREKRRD